jgi:phenylalanyl-tRNA synthetase beta chain
VLEALDVDGTLVGFEIELDEIPLPKAKATKTKPKLELSDLMPFERDFAFLAERHIKAADLVRAIQSADRNLITAVTLFDIYEGAEIPPGKKSVAIAVTLQPRDKTLTDAEIDAVAGKIIAEVQNKTGATLRG